MKRHFLCEKHRRMLARFPEKAAQCFVSTLESGEYWRRQLQWDNALPNFGCAFETIELMLTQRAAPVGQLLECYIDALDGLIDTLIQLGEVNVARDAQVTAINRLGRETGLHSDPVEFQLSRLINDLIDQLNRFQDADEPIKPSMPVPSIAEYDYAGVLH